MSEGSEKIAYKDGCYWETSVEKDSVLKISHSKRKKKKKTQFFLTS